MKDKITLGILRNLAYLLLFILIFGTISACQREEITPEEQARQEEMIEQLAQLEPYDMVLHNNGFVYMVPYSISDKDRPTRWWRLDLRREHHNPTDYEMSHLGIWATRIQRVYYQDDPAWRDAAMCYLRNCRMPTDPSQ